MLRILTLCHGNICRSPLAEVLIEAAINADPHLAGRVAVSSAGTSNEHAGEGMHANSAAILKARGLRTDHCARLLRTELARQQDLILAADRWNLRDARRILANEVAPPDVHLIRDYDPAASGADLADPWGHPISAYERTEREITDAIPGLIAILRAKAANLEF
ncbi:MAG: low molecular weight protein-tyrosine-phosphatase [Candidatus Limnocylindrus sp.]